jgi:tetraacyldisaccharide-1-P 4'-kinase
VLAVSAVARPAALYRALRDWEADLVHVLEYPDHHAYGTGEWQAIAAAAKDVDLIVTTEKDLVKLEAFPFARGKLVALRLGVEVEDADALVDAVIGDAVAADAS